jgi:hypothetical protein
MTLLRWIYLVNFTVAFVGHITITSRYHGLALDFVDLAGEFQVMVKRLKGDSRNSEVMASNPIVVLWERLSCITARATFH